MATLTQIIEEVKLSAGWTHDELNEAFRKVQNKTHWKDPVSAIVATDDLAITLVAVEFFTATKVQIVELLACGQVKIYAPGYRRGPAGDH